MVARAIQSNPRIAKLRHRRLVIRTVPSIGARVRLLSSELLSWLGVKMAKIDVEPGLLNY